MTDLTRSNEKPTNSSVSEKVRAVMIAIQQQWPSAQIDFRDPANIWANAIDTLNVAQISYGIKQLSQVTDRYPMNAAQFRAYALASPEMPEPENRIYDNSDRGNARRATNLAYANRIFANLEVNSRRSDNMGHANKALPNNAYHGDFDYMAVANAAPLPEPGQHKHDWHWREMWKLFDQEWAA